MGRGYWDGIPADKSVRVFRLPLDSGGYDPGGAYWGSGESLYCATDGQAYREFVRASSRKAAIAKLNLAPEKLKVKVSRRKTMPYFSFTTEQHCKTLENLDAVSAVRAIHQGYLQLLALDTQIDCGHFNNQPALQALETCLRQAGFAGLDNTP